MVNSLQDILNNINNVENFVKRRKFREGNEKSLGISNFFMK
jgi:hypothetical protein